MPKGLCEICTNDYTDCFVESEFSEFHDVQSCVAFSLSMEKVAGHRINQCSDTKVSWFVRTNDKAWGVEHVIADEASYSGKILVVRYGYRCSHHFHRRKHETFYVHSGKVIFHIGGDVVECTTGDVLHIPQLLIHSFGVPMLPEFPGAATIYEVATHDSPEDSYRFDESGPVDDKWLEHSDD